MSTFDVDQYAALEKEFEERLKAMKGAAGEQMVAAFNMIAEKNDLTTFDALLLLGFMIKDQLDQLLTDVGNEDLVNELRDELINVTLKAQGDHDDN